MGMNKMSDQTSGQISAYDRSQRLLYEFNLLPAAYADRSWVESNGVLKSGEHSLAQIGCVGQSVALLQHHGLNEKFDWSVQSGAVRISLLQRTAFSRVCTVLSLMCAAPEIRRTVNGEILRSLDETFGDLNSAIWCPAVPGLVKAGFGHNLVKTAENERLERARVVGFRIYKALLYADGQATPESISRALFRLPMPIATEPVTPMDSAVAKLVTRWVCKSAVKRWEPSWAWLF